MKNCEVQSCSISWTDQTVKISLYITARRRRRAGGGGGGRTKLYLTSRLFLVPRRTLAPCIGILRCSPIWVYHDKYKMTRFGRG